MMSGGGSNIDDGGGWRGTPHRGGDGGGSLYAAVRRSRGQTRMMLSSAGFWGRDNIGAAGGEDVRVVSSLLPSLAKRRVRQSGKKDAGKKLRMCRSCFEAVTRPLLKIQEELWFAGSCQDNPVSLKARGRQGRGEGIERFDVHLMRLNSKHRPLSPAGCCWCFGVGSQWQHEHRQRGVTPLQGWKESQGERWVW